jgi:cbb3-type cytochrome oxidase subunit 1
MDWFVRAFLKASLAWLAGGVTLGVAMAAHPVWSVYRVAHEHMNLLGFVTMMIYGVAYHVIPRFTGAPLHSRRLAALHLWASNLGLGAMVVGFMLRASGATSTTVSTCLLAAGGMLSAAGAYVFVFNIWNTLNAERAAAAAAQAQALRVPLARARGVS